MVDILEDESFLLGPVHISFGDGLSVVRGRIQCSAGTFAIGEWPDGTGGRVMLDDEAEGRTSVTLRGLPSDVAATLSTVEFTPPTDWNSMTRGAATLTLNVEPVGIGEVSHRSVRCCL